MKTPDVVIWGKDNGEGMVIHHKTTKGTDIYGLAMPNIYTSTDWDLGPTWCYLISGKKNTLIDTGRFGNLEYFKNLLSTIGKEITDIDRIIPTHSHEDHDGNLADIVHASRAEVWMHEIYRCMISYYPHIEDGATNPDLPGSCRQCIMTEKFREGCADYHKKRSLLNIDFAISDDYILQDEHIRLIYTPGHSPDSVCTILEDEVLFPGDSLLPDITPHPSRASTFEVNRRILPERYSKENTIFGLMVYIKSLNKLASLPSQPIDATFPAHRLFFNGKFNITHSSIERAREIIQFHIDRCSDILNIMDGKPAEIHDIALQHFPPSLLEFEGKLAGDNEITAHLEAMEECGDVTWIDEHKNTAQPTGTRNYLDIIGAYLP